MVRGQQCVAIAAPYAVNVHTPSKKAMLLLLFYLRHQKNGLGRKQIRTHPFPHVGHPDA